MESFATPYNLIFNDGDLEHDKGVVGIHSCLSFKRFQSMIGQKTGLPAAQLSTVFVCKRTVGGSEKKQKLPINENTNFAIILSQHNAMKEKDCYFLVSMKRSKKERKAGKKRVETGPVDDVSTKEEPAPSDAVTTDENSKEHHEHVEEHVSVAKATVQESVQASERLPLVTLDGKAAAEPRVQAMAKKSASEPENGSVWKSGSVLRQLSMGEVKQQSHEQLTTPQAHHASVGAAVQTSSWPAGPSTSVSPLGVLKPAATGGMVSPTSVLDYGQLRLPPHNVPFAGGEASPVLQEKSAFTLFGQGAQAVDLQMLLQEAVIANMQLKRPKWCRFCALCRERNMVVPPFHWCVDDQVVSGFRGPNPAGAIGARAMKHRVAAA